MVGWCGISQAVNGSRHLSAVRLAKGKSGPISQHGGILFSGSWAVPRGLPTLHRRILQLPQNLRGGTAPIEAHNLDPAGSIPAPVTISNRLLRSPASPSTGCKRAAIVNCCGARRKLAPAFGGIVTRLC